jgi:hypothetical protein
LVEAREGKRYRNRTDLLRMGGEEVATAATSSGAAPAAPAASTSSPSIISADASAGKQPTYLELITTKTPSADGKAEAAPAATTAEPGKEKAAKTKRERADENWKLLVSLPCGPWHQPSRSGSRFSPSSASPPLVAASSCSAPEHEMGRLHQLAFCISGFRHCASVCCKAYARCGALVRVRIRKVSLVALHPLDQGTLWSHDPESKHLLQQQNNRQKHSHIPPHPFRSSSRSAGWDYQRV